MATVLEVRLTDASIHEMVDSYKEEGYVLTPPCVPHEVCDAVKACALASARASGGMRTSINSWKNIKSSAWWQLLHWMVSASSLVSRILDNVYGDCWFFDVAGGDVVAPRAGFKCRSCLPHSDWKNVKDGIVAVSVIVHDEQDKDMAPMHLYGRTSGKLNICTGSKGQMILRDVDVIHHGSPNMTDKTRVLPCIRFILAQGLRHGYQPKSFVPYSLWQQDIDDRLSQKLIFTFSDDADEDANSPAHTRYRTPASMRMVIEDLQ